MVQTNFTAFSWVDSAKRNEFSSVSGKIFWYFVAIEKCFAKLVFSGMDTEIVKADFLKDESYLQYIFFFLSFWGKKLFFAPVFLTVKKMSEIASKVKAIIVDKLGVEESEVTPEASFTNDLGADSLDTVELIMEFEKEFNIAIPDEQAEKITTVGDAITYIEGNSK